MDKLYNKFIKTFPAEETLKKATKKLINKYEKLLPETIISLWKENGFGNYGFGLIKVINPDEYISYFKLLLKDEEVIPFLMDSFGNIFYVKLNDETVYVLNTDFAFIDMCQTNFKNFIEFLTSEIFIKNYLFKDIFDEMLIRGVIPENNEILIYNPPYILGGKRDINCIIKKDVIKYFDFIIPILCMIGVQNRIARR